MNKHSKYLLSILNIVICLLIVVSSSASLSDPTFYQKETHNWQIQSIGQDIINIFCVVPFLLITNLLTIANRPFAILLWQGCLLYLAYTYTIYCFDIHFNQYFIIYCLILGLSFYLFIYFLITTAKNTHFQKATPTYNRITATF